MAVTKSRTRHLGWLGILLFLAMPVWAQRMPAPSVGPSVAWLGKAKAPASAYAGTATCKNCHSARYAEFSKTAHAHATVAGHTYLHGCEACHGPGKAHAQAMEAAGGSDAKVLAALKSAPIWAFQGTPQQNAAVCLTCHISSKMQEGFQHSTHLAHGVACQNCHSAHLVNPLPKHPAYAQEAMFQVPRLPQQIAWLKSGQLRAPQPDLCFSCHRGVQAKFALPVHHRVPEGLLKCTDCHNPHGTPQQANLREIGWETCERCHVEKRGPFMYPHPAVQVGGCVACHNPHGTINAFLIKRRDTRTVCLQCHTGFHGQDGVPHGRLGFQTSGTCVRCHAMVHGSNFDPTLLR